MEVQELAERLEKLEGEFAEYRSKMRLHLIGEVKKTNEQTSEIRSLRKELFALAANVDAIKPAKKTTKKRTKKALDFDLFVEDRCVVGSGGSTDRPVIYEAYRKWCKETQAGRPASLIAFVRGLNNAVPTLEKRRLSRGRPFQVEVIVGISLLTESEYSPNPSRN